MSLIGPRPLLVDYLDSYSERHMMRHAVRPGLECPILQIKKRNLLGQINLKMKCIMLKM